MHTFKIIQHASSNTDLTNACHILIQLPPHPALRTHPGGHIGARPVPHIQRSLDLSRTAMLNLHQECVHTLEREPNAGSQSLHLSVCADVL